MKLPNGYGSITKLSGKRRRPWIVRITDGCTEENGVLKQHRKTLGYFETRAKALTALSEYNGKPYNLDMSGMTFAELYTAWSTDKFKRISESGVHSYKNAYRHCKPLYNDVFRNLRAKYLQDFLNATGAGYDVQKKILSLLNQMFKYAIANDITDKNYAEYVRNDAPRPDVNRVPFSEDEINLLKNIAPKEPFADAILILIYTGWRVGELLAMRRDDVDITEMTMKGGAKTEAGKDRIVPIHECIQPYVKKYYDSADKLLLPLRYDQFRVNFKAVCEKYGMNHSIHECRHTFATRADNFGMNKVCIQRHASNNITDKVYTHKDITELRKAIAMLP